MQLSDISKRLPPVIARKAREFTQPIVRDLQAPAAKPRDAATKSSAAPGKKPDTLTGWTTEDLMTAVRKLLVSGQAVARGRFLNLRI